MSGPRLVLGFDHRTRLQRCLTLTQWHDEIDELTRGSDTMQIQSAPHATCIYDARGPVLEIEAGLDEIRTAHIADNGRVER